MRRSPLHDRLAAAGAVFGSRGGWERPNWFAPAGVEPVDEPSFTGGNWFEHVGREALAVRNGVALIDQTSFAKFEIAGPGALDAVQWLSVADMDKSVGTVTYTQLCNEQGGIECDLTMIRTAPDTWYVVTGAAFGAHDMGWIRSHCPDRRHASRCATSRRRGASSTSAARSLATCCRRRARRTCRTPPSGTAGHVSSRSGRHRCWRCASATPASSDGSCTSRPSTPPTCTTCCGKPANRTAIVNVGYRAIDRLRVEKGYVYWSTDVTPDTTPLEAGLDWRINWDKGDFCGRAALDAQRRDGVERKLCTFTLEPEPGQAVYPVGGEAIILGDSVVGFTTTANFGHAISKPIAYGYVGVEHLERQDWVDRGLRRSRFAPPATRAPSTTRAEGGCGRERHE